MGKSKATVWYRAPGSNVRRFGMKGSEPAISYRRSAFSNRFAGMLLELWPEN